MSGDRCRDAPNGASSTQRPANALAPGELDALLDGLPTSIVYRLELKADGERAYH